MSLRDVFEGVGAIGIGDEDVIESGAEEAGLEGGAVAAIDGMLEEGDREGAGDFAGAVAGAVVDDDDFEGFEVDGLLLDGGDGFGDGALLVEGGDEDADGKL